MDIQKKLSILSDAAKYDASCASSGAKRAGEKGKLGHTTGSGICHSYTPDGRCVSLLKILLTNHCIFDCQYCINRSSSDVQRARFTPEEVVHLTIEFYRRNYIEGLFLSSGIIQSPDYTMEQLARVAKILREEKGFNGYIHLKTVPGASQEWLDQAGRYADRLSVNVELPTASDLKTLAPEKSLPEIEQSMDDIRQRVQAAKEERSKSPKAPTFAPSGQSTQMIVGATQTADGTILQTAQQLYSTHKLRRIYYSAFSPIPFADGRLPFSAPPLIREHRLYQSDWLMRYYGFKPDEIASPDENLDVTLDPKLAWALRHRAFFPVDVNTAPREKLLRIPGVGVRNVEAILRIRRHKKIRLQDLQRLRVSVKRALPFLICEDHFSSALEIDRLALRSKVAPPQSQQMLLFDAAESASSGEV